jgi:hypothetical protein
MLNPAQPNTSRSSGRRRRVTPGPRKASVRSPTSGWRSRLMPDLWSRTFVARPAHAELVAPPEVADVPDHATTADHIILRSRGRPAYPLNDRASCMHCNAARGDGHADAQEVQARVTGVVRGRERFPRQARTGKDRMAAGRRRNGHEDERGQRTPTELSLIRNLGGTQGSPSSSTGVLRCQGRSEENGGRPHLTFGARGRGKVTHVRPRRRSFARRRPDR